MSHEVALQAGVVKRMIAADPLDENESFQVRVFLEEGVKGGAIPCVMTDGKDHVRGLLIGNAATLCGLHEVRRPLVLAVESYVASQANVKDQEALVYIAAARIVHRQRKAEPPAGRRTTAPGQKRIAGGGAPAFLQHFLPVLSDTALCGGRFFSPEAREQVGRVSRCLAQQSAMCTLHQSMTSSSSQQQQQPPHDPHSSSSHDMMMMKDRTVHYMTAQREFQASQMDRQKASLTSNSDREDAVRSSLIVEQHDKALHEALDDPQFLTTEKLCYWHSILCGGGVHAEAGRLRTKAVRVGHVHFRHHKHVKEDLSVVCQELCGMESRLLAKVNAPNSRESSGLAAVTLAAAVLFSIIDVHAFADGNGRLARVALNWALRRLGVPFVLHLFATPSQRSEYTEALVKTRRNLALVGRGHCSESDVVYALEEAGAYSPLVELILDRLSKTCAEFEKLVQEKSRIGSEDAELRAAKRVRDRERAGTCLICFDEQPNIATLCCGKAVHLNCVAQWISSNASCPACREEFPALTPRVRAPETAYNDDDTTDDDENFEESDTTEMDTDDVGPPDGYIAAYNALETEARRNSLLLMAYRALEGDAISVDNDDTASVDNDDTASDDMEPDDTTDAGDVVAMSDTPDTLDSTPDAPYRPDIPPLCLQCRNRAARNCSNATCGRCCLLHGTFSCERHNTA
jgi:fido (protein-threonine AMPylation protein)